MIPGMDFNWQVSSHSAGGNCLEACWQASSFSFANGNCLEARWQVSPHSTGNGECLEARQDGAVLVRDTKDRAGPVLRIDPAAWARFTRGLKGTGG